VVTRARQGLLRALPSRNGGDPNAAPVNYAPAAVCGLLLVIAVFALRSGTDFSFRTGPVVLVLAAASTLPLGWFIVRLLAPGLQPLNTRLALMVAAGLTASIFIGFFLGVAGVQGLYLPVCLVVLAAWAVVQVRPYLGRPLGQVWAGWQWPQPQGWVVVALGLAAIIVAVPFMATSVRVSDTLFVDYAYIDTFYFMIRTHVLSQGAPAALWADLSGVRPLVYPDYFLFWLGQLAAWSGASSRDLYFIDGPIILILIDTLMLYAVGRELTQSRWGGYLAAALGWLVVWPNPYDSNFLLRNIDTLSEFTAVRIHFFALRVNLSQGAGNYLFTGAVLALLLAARSKAPRLQMGLLTVGSLLMVGTLRVRSNIFVVAAPPFMLVFAYLAWRWRSLRALILPVLVFGLLAGALYLESTSAHYDQTTGSLAVAFSPFGDHAIKFIPDSLKAIFDRLPYPIKPFAVVTGVTWLRMIGLVFGLGAVARLVQWLRRRGDLTLTEVYLHVVTLVAIVAAVFLVRDVEEFLASGGDFGAQTLLLAARIGLLLGIIPLWQLGRRVAGWLRAYYIPMPQVALGALLLAGVVTRQAADVQMHDYSSKGYPVTDLERNSYYWITQNTPPLAVIAADPAHKVNPWGDTIETTNFLSGMTERPAYLQRYNYFFVDTVMQHRQVLADLFNAPNPDAVRAALAQADFDYLLVYPDHQPVTDLGCCLSLLFNGEPQIYGHQRP
jgi:hypothetical protein